MTRLLLVRHGESTANLNNVFAGHYDPQLTELGHRQAECTGRFVLGNYKVSAIYSSDLHRAFDTAQHFADIAGLAVIPEPRLREIYAGEWEEMSFSEVEQTYAEDWNRWRVDPANAVCTGGESVRQLADRVFAAVQEIAKNHEKQTVLVATHATPIKVAMWKILGSEPETIKNLSWVSNASVTELIWEEDHFTIGKVSQDAHLADMRTVLNINI